MLKLKLQYLGHLMRRADSLEKTRVPHVQVRAQFSFWLWKCDLKEHGWSAFVSWLYVSELFRCFSSTMRGQFKNHKTPCLGKWILRDFSGNKQFLEDVCSLGPRLQHFSLQLTLLALDRAPQSELALANISCYCLFWIQSFCVPTDSLSLSQVWSQGEIVSAAKDLCVVLNGGFFPSNFRAFCCTCGV